MASKHPDRSRPAPALWPLSPAPCPGYAAARGIRPPALAPQAGQRQAIPCGCDS